MANHRQTINGAALHLEKAVISALTFSMQN
jgi:hypothetical protein